MNLWRSLLVVAFLALAIQGNSLPAHSQALTQEQAYYNALLALHTKLKIAISQLGGKVNQTLINANQFDHSPTLQKVILEEAADQERNLILQNLQNSSLPLDLKSWACKNLTQSQIDFFKAKAQNLNSKVAIIQDKINNLQSCQRTSELNYSSKLLKVDVQNLQSEMNNTCTPVKPQALPKKNISNLTPQNWVYDGSNKTKEEDKLDDLAKEYTLTPCPLETPYLINGKCDECPNEYYSLTKEQCITCPEGTTFLNNDCLNPEVKYPISNLDNNEDWVYGTLTPQQYNDTRQKMIDNGQSYKCQEEKPFAAANLTCIQCPALFDLSTKQCFQKCPEGTTLDTKSHLCKPAINIPNFVQDNWVYGPQGKEGFDEKMNNISKQYDLVKCPQDKPYPLPPSGQCGICNSIYDLSSQTCTGCPSNYQINKTSHTCQQRIPNCPLDKPFYTGQGCIQCKDPGNFDQFNKTCVCPQGSGYDYHEEQCLPTTGKNMNPGSVNYKGTPPPYNSLISNCPKDKPYYNGNQCIECNIPLFYDFDKAACMKCEGIQTFDINKKICVNPIPNVPQYNSNSDPTIQNYCCGKPPNDPSLQTCPISTPYFNGRNCQNCNEPSYFNFSELVCKACPQGEQFDSTQKTCKNKIPQMPIYKSYLPPQIQNYKGHPPQITPVQGQKIEYCPKQNNYYDGKFCVACKLPRYFNFEEMKCENCISTQEFSLREKKCVEKVLDKDRYNSYLVDNKNFRGKIPTYNPGIKTCTAQKPYSTGHQCIQCQLPSFFDFDVNKCLSCQLQAQYFNLGNRMCQYRKQDYVTDIHNPNIYYNGNYQNVIAEVKKKRQQNPSIEVCMSSTPFYDARTNKCISCPSNKPYYNFKYNSCIKCKENTYFDQDYRVCINNYKVQPTIERMIMNTFDWV